MYSSIKLLVDLYFNIYKGEGTSNSINVFKIIIHPTLVRQN